MSAKADDLLQLDVHELLEQAKRLEAWSTRVVGGSFAGGYRSVFRGSGIEFDEIREYVPGDDPRAIDWNVTARTGRPFLKQFVEERELTAIFVADLNPAVDDGFGARTTREAITRLCAILALAAAQNDDKTGLVAFGDRIERFVPARRGLRHAMRLVEALSSTRTNEAPADLATALDHATRTTRRNAAMFIVSDFLHAPERDQRVRESLRLCREHHDPVVVWVRPPELRLPELIDACVPGRAPILRLRDPVTGAERAIDFGHAPTRRGFEAAVQQQRERVESLCHSQRVDLIEFDVPREHDPDAVLRPLLAFLQRRGGAR